MTSKERVLKVFNHELPDRVPLWCGTSPEFMEKCMTFLNVKDEEQVRQRLGDDFRRVYHEYIGPKERSWTEALPDGITMRTPFNVERSGYAFGQAVSHPLAGATLQEIDNYPWPKAEWYSAKHIKSDLKKWEGEYAILGGDWSPFWHDVMDLMGMEEMFIKMYTDPKIVHAIFDKVVDYYLGVNRLIFEEAGDGIDIHFIGNDLGSQNGPLIGCDLFEEFVAPHLKKISDLTHSYGLKIMMHCCGGYEPFMDSLIENGIDALQAIQPDAMGMDPENLKRRYGSRIILNGGIDSHHVLINGNPELVVKATTETMSILKPGGNFILSPSHDYLLEETPVENVIAMYDRAREIHHYSF